MTPETLANDSGMIPERLPNHSGAAPERLRNDSVLKGREGIGVGKEGIGREGNNTLPPQQLAGSRGTGRENVIDPLVSRGVNPEKAMELAGLFDAARVQAAVAYFDAQRSGSVGPGVLVAAVREGRTPPQEPRSMLGRQQDYAASIVEWLEANFPDLCRPRHGPHPAAVACVIRLHYRDGKGSLTKARHGPEIRAAVEAWELKWSDEQ